MHLSTVGSHSSRLAAILLGLGHGLPLQGIHAREAADRLLIQHHRRSAILALEALIDQQGFGVFQLTGDLFDVDIRMIHIIFPLCMARF